MLVLYAVVPLAFIGDVLIFDISFGVLEIIGSGIVSVCTGGIIVNSLYCKKKNKNAHIIPANFLKTILAFSHPSKQLELRKLNKKTYD